MYMDEGKIVKAIEQGRKDGKEIIKWWRKENDFVDYELIENFLQDSEKRHAFENFELLDKDEMWEILKQQIPEGLYHRVATKSDTIEWQHVGIDGETDTYVCPYNAHSIMAIFDAETKGDTLL